MPRARGHLAAELHLGVHGGDAHGEGFGLLALEGAEAHAGRDGPGHGGAARSARRRRHGGLAPPPRRAIGRAARCARPRRTGQPIERAVLERREQT